eukprot:jgi/Mesen1/4334/ME000022S03625
MSTGGLVVHRHESRPGETGRDQGESLLKRSSRVPGPLTPPTRQVRVRPASRTLTTAAQHSHLRCSLPPSSSDLSGSQGPGSGRLSMLAQLQGIAAAAAAAASAGALDGGTSSSNSSSPGGSSSLASQPSSLGHAPGSHGSKGGGLKVLMNAGKAKAKGAVVTVRPDADAAEAGKQNKQGSGSSSSSGSSDLEPPPLPSLAALSRDGQSEGEPNGNGSARPSDQKPRQPPKEPSETKMLAAVDLGTNSFHMVIVKAKDNGRFEIEDVEKEDVRLGSGSAGFSMITPDAEERALSAIKRLKKIATNRKAVMRVVATSAVREARNKRTFVRRIREATGVDVEVLSGREEACLIYMGILQALPVFSKTVLTVDIGGGSTEFVLGREGRPLFATSLKLGHIRLTEKFIDPEGLQRSQVEEMRRYIRVMLADCGILEIVHATDFEVAIGSSGTIETLGQMIQLNPSSSSSSNSSSSSSSSSAATALAPSSDEVLPEAPKEGEEVVVKEKDKKSKKGSAGGGNGGGSSSSQASGKGVVLKEREFGREELSAVVKKICKAKTPEQRAKLPGLPEKRADVIVGGAVLLEEIFASMGIEKMMVSPYALREGVIVDTLARTCDSYMPSPHLRRSSVFNLAQKFNIDRRLDSAIHSAKLARELMAGLQTCRTGGMDCMSEAVAQLEPVDMELLDAATILHYVGMFISHKGYHKHSHYLIKNNEHLLGYTPLEVEIIALLARYHRKKVPSSKDEDLAKLPEEVQKKIKALSAVIRVAVALDRCDSGAVESVHVLQDRGSCALVVTPALDPVTGCARDVSLEIWAATAELPYFEKIFKRKPSLVIADHQDADTLTEERSSSLSS